LNKALRRFTKAFLCRQTKDRFDVEYVFERLIRSDIQAHLAIGDMARDADIADHAAARHDLPVAIGCACRGGGGFGSAAVLPVFPTRGVGQLHDGGVAAGLLGMRGKPWVLAMDRTNWDSGKMAINILMILVIWNGMGVPLIWTLLPPELAEGFRLFTPLS
jgi:hypothetical protein